MFWVIQTVQIVWLAYQMYIIVVMHLTRHVGFERLGHLEDNLAYELATHGSVRLHSHKAGTIWAKLRSVPVLSIREGREVSGPEDRPKPCTKAHHTQSKQQ